MDKGSWYRYDAQEVEERLKYCLAVMHSFGLIHKDVKLQNILINGANIPVLADFGISTAVFERPGENHSPIKKAHSFTCHQKCIR